MINSPNQYSCVGIEDYLSRYKETIYNVSKEMGPLRKIDGETADKICKSLFQRVPAEKLGDAMRKRDRALIKLAKLRSENLYTDI